MTEAAIQAVLTERDQVLGIKDTIPTGTVNPSDVIQMNGDQVQSPETYFGAARNEYLQNGDQSKTGPQTLTIPATISSNVLYLGGTWNFQNEYAETTTPAEIDYTYNSKNVYFVASSQNGATIEISVDGKPLGALAGKDVGGDSTATIKDNRLYDLVHGDAYGTHTLKIQVKNGTLDAYTFTFG